MRWLYTFVLYLTAPLFVVAALKRVRREQHLRGSGTWCTRFAACLPALPKGGIWLHAVSAGETRSAFPLIKRLRAAYPNTPIVLTYASLNGLEHIRAWPERDLVVSTAIPYDYPFAIKRFLRAMAPCLIVILETEIWPNLYQFARQQSIPLLLLNARLSKPSLAKYLYIKRLVAATLNKTTHIGAQSAVDAAHFRALGVAPDNLSVVGNLKFNADIDDAMLDAGNTARRTRYAAWDFVWCAGSTHAEEEAVLLKVHRQLEDNALLILAPRHRERFDQVMQLLEKHALHYVCHSRMPEVLPPETRVVLVNALGVLLPYYAAADAVFIGGTLVPFGGHNFLEAAALHKPVLAGPYVQNLQVLFDAGIQADALDITHTPLALASRLKALWRDKALRTARGAKAHAFFHSQTNALDANMAIIDAYIPRPCAPHGDEVISNHQQDDTSQRL